MNEETIRTALELSASIFAGQIVSRVHGLPHWLAVLSNAKLLAHEEKVTNEADLDLLVWFAFMHDALRLNDDGDPEHGPRSADYLIGLSKRRPCGEGWIRPEAPHFNLLDSAIRHHSYGHTQSNILVQICWDADRLDLPRCGTTPDPDRMCTATGKRLATRLQNMALAERIRPRGKSILAPHLGFPR